MPLESDVIRIRHMREAAREALTFASGRVRTDLDTDRMLALAIVKAIEIVGEAAVKVSDESRGSLTGIPWADIINMRHRLTHSYFDIDLDIVWSTVQTDLPPLLAAIERWLDTQEG